MDLAIALLVTAAVQALADERWAPIADLHALDTESLRRTLESVIRGADRTEIEDPALLAVLGRKGPMEASDLWSQLASELAEDHPAWRELHASLDLILREGPLARRLVTSLSHEPDADLIETVWRRLGRSLVSGDAFVA